MRTVLLLLIAAIPLGSGCASLTPKSGDGLLSDLTTREQVRARFGAPVATGIIKGHEYDEYREPVMLGHATIGGSGHVSDATLRFVYDPVGRVTSTSEVVDKGFREATGEDLGRILQIWSGKQSSDDLDHDSSPR